MVKRCGPVLGQGIFLLYVFIFGCFNVFSYDVVLGPRDYLASNERMLYMLSHKNKFMD